MFWTFLKVEKKKCKIHIFLKREMLTDALRAKVNNPFKESFYWKRKKKLMF